MTRTIIYGRKQEPINRLLYILSYFLRCSEIQENRDKRVLTPEIQEGCSNNLASPVVNIDFQNGQAKCTCLKTHPDYSKCEENRIENDFRLQKLRQEGKIPKFIRTLQNSKSVEKLDVSTEERKTKNHVALGNSTENVAANIVNSNIPDMAAKILYSVPLNSAPINNKLESNKNADLFKSDDTDSGTYTDNEDLTGSELDDTKEYCALSKLQATEVRAIEQVVCVGNAVDPSSWSRSFVEEFHQESPTTPNGKKIGYNGNCPIRSTSSASNSSTKTIIERREQYNELKKPEFHRGNSMFDEYFSESFGSSPIHLPEIYVSDEEKTTSVQTVDCKSSIQTLEKIKMDLLGADHSSESSLETSSEFKENNPKAVRPDSLTWGGARPKLVDIGLDESQTSSTSTR